MMMDLAYVDEKTVTVTNKSPFKNPFVLNWTTIG